MPISPAAFMFRPWPILPLLLLLFAAGACGERTSPGAASAARADGPAGPELVRVHDFAVSPAEVRLDPWLSAQFSGALDGDDERTRQELEAGHRLADAVAEALVREVRALGVAAERAVGPLPPEGDVLVVKGVILSRGGAAEGSEVVGLATGRTSTRAEMFVHDAGPAWMRESETFGLVEAGLASVAPAAGPAAGASAVASSSSSSFSSSSSTHAPRDEEAEGIARELAGRLGETFARKAWLPSRP